MRTLILSLVLGAATLGLVGVTPSSAQAQWRRGFRNPTYDNLRSIYNYHYSIQNYGPFGAPYGYTGNYGYNYWYNPGYSSYSYGPGYYNYSYNPGYLSYYYSQPPYSLYYYAPGSYYGY